MRPDAIVTSTSRRPRVICHMIASVGARTLMLEGGGRINGGMPRADDAIRLRYRVAEARA